MLKLIKRLLITLTVVFVWAVAYAQVPRLINYQGRLTDKTSKPLEGSYELTFRIYDDEASGTLLWEETHPTVVIQKGIFSILLGSIKALDLPFDKQYFLEIKVGDETMTPRQRIASSAYAMRAEAADNSQRLNNQPSSYYLDHGNLSGASDNDHPQYIKSKVNNALMDFGNGSWVSQNQEVNVTFNVGFSFVPSVAASVDETGGRLDDHGVECEIYNVSTNGFTFRNGRCSSVAFKWIAIGY